MRILKTIEDRESLKEPTEVVYTHLGRNVIGKQFPAETELLYDIATSLRLLIDAVVETWKG